jgi:hypothetical protein
MIELKIRADTPILPVSEINVLKFMSFLYVILFYNFVCNYLDEKLIIYPYV